MNPLERLRQIIAQDEAGGWDDAVLVGGVMLVLYVAYSIAALLLGYDINGLANALRRVTFLTAVYSLVVLALNLQWGYTGLFNIGVIGYMGVGVYTMAILTRPVNPETATAIPGFGLPLSIAIVLGMLVTAVVGFLTALPALRLRADYLAIVTIGISEIIRFTLKSVTFQRFTVFGKTMGTGGGSGLNLSTDPEKVVVDTFLAVDRALGSPVIELGRSFGIQPTVVEGWVYSLFLIVVVLGFFLLLRRVGNSPFGRVLRAIKEDEDATNSLGKNTNRFKIKVFMLGTALMGLAGMLWQGSQGFLNPNAFRPETTFFVWIALIIGGAGSNTGSILGSAFFAALLFEGPRYVQNLIQTTFELGSVPPNVIDAVAAFGSLEVTPFLAYVLGQMSAIRLILMGLVLIWLMHNRPDGLLGHRKEPATAIPILGSRPGGSDDE
ncbi:MAG: branched-chain amino acid ABC transporter permease [Halanaeroarchaeum sp.]